MPHASNHGHLAPRICFLDCRVEEVGSITLVRVDLEIDGRFDSKEIRSPLDRDGAIHSAIQQMLPHYAVFLKCDVGESDGQSFSAAVQLGWNGQHVVGHGTDEKSNVRAIALANLNAVIQILCGGPTH